MATASRARRRRGSTATARAGRGASSCTTSGEVQSVNISDPVAGSMYVLNPATRTAYRNGVVMSGGRGGFATATVAPGSGGGGAVTAMRTPEADVTVAVRGRRDGSAARGRNAGGRRGAAGGAEWQSGGSGAAVAEAPLRASAVPGRADAGADACRQAGGNVNKEELGQQVVEGVLATGTRTTTTLPAGTIGNEQPIVVVSEQWFSEDLKILVMTKHSDPRSGETTYRLTNVVQAEPARSLFEVPADYTLKDSVIRRQSPMQQTSCIE